MNEPQAPPPEPRFSLRSLQRLNRAEALGFSAVGISVCSLLLWILPGRDAGRPVGSPDGASTEQNENASTGELASSTLSILTEASAKIAERVTRSVVRVESSFNGSVATNADDLETYFGPVPQERFGSGVVVGSAGLVLTNYHVVRGARSIAVVRSDGKSLAASMAGFDSLTDLALLDVPGLELKALPWVDGPGPAPGSLVWSVGCPYELDQSVSLGIVSSSNRATLLDSPYQDFLQTDAAINPGQSGGALVDDRGRLVGITTAIAGEHFQGIGFALPSNMAQPVFAQLRDNGEVVRGWIGVELGKVTAARAAMAGLSRPSGAYVEALIGGAASPAYTAGLRRGDICLSMDGQEVVGPLGLIRKIAAQGVGQRVALSVLRDNELKEIRVQISKRPR